jgi:hypothetical protein
MPRQIDCEFKVGKLYWNKYPYDIDENQPYIDLKTGERAYYIDDDDRCIAVLTYLGPASDYHEQYYEEDHGDIDQWGVFLIFSRRYFAYKADLCECTQELLEQIELYRQADKEQNDG